MGTIQTDVSGAALITAIRANMNDFFRHVGKYNPHSYFESADFIRWYSPVPHPWFNGVLALRAGAEQDHEFIQDSMSFFKDKGAHTFTWWYETHLHQKDWEDVLSRHKFAFSNDTPGMAVDLNALDKSAPRIEGFEIREAKDDESIKVWAEIFVKGYGLPVDWTPVVYDLWLVMSSTPLLQNYVGYLNGKPVATSSAFYGGGNVGIYSVATLPEARGKGIGAAITLKPLQNAREAGYHVGTLQSSDMGFNVYKKLGFRHLCQIENFYRNT